MTKLRSAIALMLALVLVLFVSVGEVSAARARKVTPTYTAEQIATITEYAADLSAMKSRFSELVDLIEAENWVFVRNFLHGPLGDIRFRMSGISRNLLPDVQESAKKLEKSVMANLIGLDQTAAAKDYKGSLRNYAEVVRDLDAFLALVPQ